MSDYYHTLHTGQMLQFIILKVFIVYHVSTHWDIGVLLHQLQLHVEFKFLFDLPHYGYVCMTIDVYKRDTGMANTSILIH